MNTKPQSPQLVGETVTISYLESPSLSYGQFRLENPRNVPVNVLVKSASLEIGKEQQPITKMSIFDLSQDTMLDIENLNVAAETTLMFLLGFPSISYEPYFGQSVAVRLRIDISGVELEALSLIKFIRRIPHNP